MTRTVPALALVALVVLAGCSLPLGGTDDAGDPDAPPDPANDRLGWEDGYWHNESVVVDQTDGLNDSELDAFVARAMARVEYVRDLEFESRVPVSVESREAYRNRTSGGSGGGAHADWNDQVWEATFVIGEQNDTESEIGQTLGASVAGFYSPGDDEIKIITPTPDSPTIDNATLVHELVHALQDQHGLLGAEALPSSTQDGQLAADGLVEGEANYVEARYRQRCGAEWACVRTPSSGGGGGGGGGGGPNPGVLLTIFQPYSDGPVWIDERIEAGGWAAVTDAYQDPPVSTEQVIHLTDDEPIPLDFQDRARGGWETFPDQGENGSDTVGEASIFVGFWYQSRYHDAGVVDPRELSVVSNRYDTYNYDATPSAGWGNDRVVPYHNDGDFGYVWKTVWDTPEDARQFRDAHREILDAHDAERAGPANTWVIPDGEFADAFRVVRNGTQVTIVNGPAVEDLDDIRPRAGDGGEDTSSPTDPAETPGAPIPGFGPLVALVAIAGALFLARRGRRRA